VVKQAKNELDALISLIDEPDREMYLTIREKISGYGKEAIPRLEEAWLHSENPESAERLEHIIDEIRFNDLYHELKSWADFQNNDLLKAFLLISKFRFPDLDEDKYISEFERLKQDVWLEINDNLTALEKIKVINHVLFEIHQFKGQSPKQKSSLNTYFLNELLDSKTGNALTLGMLYMTIAQQLRIPIFGIDLPDHFILAYMDDSMPAKEIEDFMEDEVLFYLNALNKGAVFTQNEIELYLKQMKLEINEAYFRPCSNKSIIRRLITEIADTYILENMPEKADTLNLLLSLLD